MSKIIIGALGEAEVEEEPENKEGRVKWCKKVRNYRKLEEGVRE